MATKAPNKAESVGTKSVLVKLRITPEQKAQWQAMARKGGISLSEMICRAIEGGGVPMAPQRSHVKGSSAIGGSTAEAEAIRQTVKGEPTEKRPRAALPNWNQKPSNEPPAKDVLDAIRANVWLDPLGKGNVCYDCKVGEGEKHKGSCGYAARMAANIAP